MVKANSMARKGIPGLSPLTGAAAAWLASVCSCRLELKTGSMPVAFSSIASPGKGVSGNLISDGVSPTSAIPNYGLTPPTKRLDRESVESLTVSECPLRLENRSATGWNRIRLSCYGERQAKCKPVRTSYTFSLCGQLINNQVVTGHQPDLIYAHVGTVYSLGSTCSLFREGSDNKVFRRKPLELQLFGFY